MSHLSKVLGLLFLYRGCVGLFRGSALMPYIYARIEYSRCKVRGMEFEFKVPDPTGALRISGT